MTKYYTCHGVHFLMRDHQFVDLHGVYLWYSKDSLLVDLQANGFTIDQDNNVVNIPQEQEQTEEPPKENEYVRITRDILDLQFVYQYLKKQHDTDHVDFGSNFTIERYELQHGGVHLPSYAFDGGLYVLTLKAQKLTRYLAFYAEQAISSYSGEKSLTIHKITPFVAEWEKLTYIVKHMLRSMTPFRSIEPMKENEKIKIFFEKSKLKIVKPSYLSDSSKDNLYQVIMYRKVIRDSFYDMTTEDYNEFMMFGDDISVFKERLVCARDNGVIALYDHFAFFNGYTRIITLPKTLSSYEHELAFRDLEKLKNCKLFNVKLETIGGVTVFIITFQSEHKKIKEWTNKSENGKYFLQGLVTSKPNNETLKLIENRKITVE
jgi:hypothetical protein